MKNLNRYKILRITDLDGNARFSIEDKEHPRIKFPLYETRKAAEIAMAAQYELTPEELKELKRRKAK